MEILQDHGDDAFDQALNDILALEEDPTPEDAEHLRKTRDHYRIYICRSLYRAVYRVLFGKRIGARRAHRAERFSVFERRLRALVDLAKQTDQWIPNMRS